SMYGLNAGVPKTAVRSAVAWYGSIWPDIDATLADIIATPVSPELLPADPSGHIAQKTEDLVGPYELHDFFLYQLLAMRRSPAVIRDLAERAFAEKFSSEEIEKWLQTFLRRFFSQQFKRSCMPDGPKVCAVSLSPRGDWRAPSDASSAPWLNDLK
ncbi:MAG: NAD(+) synthase, partial [Muribaculaceae bacterium]|nr:NAD(+) synthase [Muribaculaceae bacterium]